MSQDVLMGASACITVVSAGIARSGSTWMFNAVNALLNKKFEWVDAGWVEDIDQTRPCQVRLVKIHDPDEYWRDRADVILTCRRDLRDIAVSIRSMGWAKNDQHMIDAARRSRSHHEFWEPFAGVDLDYDTIIRAPVLAIELLAEALDIWLPQHDLQLLEAQLPRKAEKLGPGGYDTETLLHPNHCNDGRAGRWRQQLSPAAAEAIWAENEAWLKANRYERG